VIDGEDEVGGVAGRSAGIGERALVDEHQVVPTELRQVLDQAVADDAGADDGNPCGPRTNPLGIRPAVNPRWAASLHLLAL